MAHLGDYYTPAKPENTPPPGTSPLVADLMSSIFDWGPSNTLFSFWLALLARRTGG